MLAILKSCFNKNVNARFSGSETFDEYVEFSSNYK